MLRALHQHFNARQTPQIEPIPGRSDMVQNNAGGYGWALGRWDKLDRFLVLGTEGGTFYVGEKELTVDNAQSVIECIKENPYAVINRIVEVSQQGRAAKNDYALFALALVLTHVEQGSERWNADTRAHAYEAMPQVARIGTHLFQFLTYVDAMKGWSAGLRRATARWYNRKTPEDLSYQLTKYQQRYGFSHRDALRLAHPVPATEAHRQLMRYATEGKADVDALGGAGDYLAAANHLLRCNPTQSEAVHLIEKHRLPREVVPTELLNSPGVWRALLGEDATRMPVTALIRNLGNLTKHEVLKPMTDLSRAVARRLASGEAIKKARVHPFSVLAALMTYRSGGGYRGCGTWAPVGEIVEALEAAFYNAFENVEPTNKRIIYGVDVSASMTYAGGVAGIPDLSPAKAAGAMALVCAATESRFEVWGFDHSLYGLDINKSSTLKEAFAAASRSGGATDASLPIRYATEKELEVDAFVLATDSETWYGPSHPAQALGEYRRKSGIPTKLVVVGMTANDSTIGDTQDGGTLDVVGLATDTPRLVGDFLRS